MLKHVYRRGLALRYGKAMQCIAGIRCACAGPASGSQAGAQCGSQRRAQIRAQARLQARPRTGFHATEQAARGQPAGPFSACRLSRRTRHSTGRSEMQRPPTRSPFFGYSLHQLIRQY